MLNPSEWNNIITVLVALIGPTAVQDGISDSMLKNALNGIIAVGVVGYALWSHWNMKKVPESATVIPPVAKAIAFFIIGGFLLVGIVPGARAATVSKAAPAKDPLAVVQAFTVSDLQAALADAQQVGDTVAAACYMVLIPYVQANVKNPLPGQLGAFIAFQKARDLQSTINAGVPSQINVACAPLVLDAANTVIGLGAKVGISLAMPFKLPLP